MRFPFLHKQGARAIRADASSCRDEDIEDHRIVPSAPSVKEDGYVSIVWYLLRRFQTDYVGEDGMWSRFLHRMHFRLGETTRDQEFHPMSMLPCRDRYADGRDED